MIDPLRPYSQDIIDAIFCIAGLAVVIAILWRF
jgi:hypothetical protein